ncbi:MAG: uroporphyrinogen decarboxylase [Myxococcales bacterium]|nr:uroporphyrinogen decarboxylase [Myxococcales bacterium]
MTEPLFLRACRNQPTERTPIWLMRQAGRYMAEYRAVRAKVDFWTLCQTPELACEVTLQPIEAYGLDAAIIFSDLLTLLPPMGAPVEFSKGHGPVVHDGVQAAADVDRLKHFDVADDLGYVAAAVRATVAALPAHVPLIGFAGAPFTLASYLIEGGSSRQFMKTKAFLHQEPAAADRLFALLADVSADLLCLQAEAGCRALQIFDSWAGCLDPADYADWGLRYTKRMVDRIRARHPGVPVIVFAKGTGTYLDLVGQCGADVLGVDWTLSLDRARALVGPSVSLQGNLDPGRLFGPWSALQPAIDRILDAAGDGTGHIFNLGHGIHQHTSPERVGELIRYVQQASAARRTTQG